MNDHYISEYGNLIASILIGIIIGLFIISWIILNESKRKKTLTAVIETSEIYSFVNSFKEKNHIFRSSPVYNFTRPVKSKAQLDKMNVDIYIMNVLKETPTIVELVEHAVRNEDIYNKWVKESANVPSKSADFIVNMGLNPKMYNQMEENFIREMTANIKKNIPVFRIHFTYTSPKGKNSYTRSFELTGRQAQGYYKKIHQSDLYKESAKFQRSLMTPSLRYDVMKRDNFKCVLCGRKASDGVTLHVDHIIPVSKGGKTEKQNLRTLCDACNLGKGAKLE